MFRCEECKKVTRPRERLHRMIAETKIMDCHSSPCIQIAKESKACSKCADIMISYYGLKET